MHFDGLVIGVGTFLIIGVLHPVVIKMEYHIGTKAWPVFLVTGVACIALSLFSHVHILSALLSVSGFSLLWSIRELFEQTQRVKNGWYPSNPRKDTRCSENKS